MNRSYLFYLKSKKYGKKNVVFIISFIHVLIVFTLVLKHEPWRDELQSLSLMRSSSGYIELFDNKFYETHPYGYFLFFYTLLKPLAFDLTFFKFIHLIISEVLVFFILFRSPLPKRYALLLIFSYFFIYEYGVISRNYAIGILLLFAAFYYYQLNEKKWMFFLLLSAEANICAWIIAVAFFVTHLFIKRKLFQKSEWIKFSIVFGLLFFFLIDTLPGKPSAINGGIAISLRNLGLGFTKLYDAFVALPVWKIEFWETNYLNNIYLKFFLSFILMIISSLVIYKSRMAIFFWIVVSFVFFTFFGFIHVGSLRHHGFLVVAYLFAIWLAYIDGNQSPRLINHKLLKPFFLIAMSFHFYASIVCSYFEYYESFSNSKEVAKWIFSNHANTKIIGLKETHISPIAYYLNKPLYSIEADRFCTFVKWDIKNISLNLKYLDSVKMKVPKGGILLMDTREKDIPGFRLIKSFEGSIVKSENYYCYFKL